MGSGACQEVTVNRPSGVLSEEDRGMEELVKYRKQKSVFLVLNPQSVTVQVFFNLKACLQWINGLEQMRLSEHLVYSKVSYQISKGGSFVFQLGGSPHSVKKMLVHGAFSTSVKRASHLKTDQVNGGFSADVRVLGSGKIVGDIDGGGVSDQEFNERTGAYDSRKKILRCGNYRAVRWLDQEVWDLYEGLYHRGKAKSEREAGKWCTDSAAGVLIQSGVVG